MIKAKRVAKVKWMTNHLNQKKVRALNLMRILHKNSAKRTLMKKMDRNNNKRTVRLVDILCIDKKQILLIN